MNISTALKLARVKQFFVDRREHLIRLKLFQWMFFLKTFLRYPFFLWVKKDYYEAHAAALRYERIALSVPGWVPSSLMTRINAKLIASLRTPAGSKRWVDAYLQSERGKRYRQEFADYGWEYRVRLKYPRENDHPSRQGDLLMLKPFIGSNEKGVLLIKYFEAFYKFVSNYHISKVGEKFRIVLEPSFWGYRDPSFFLFMHAGTDIVVQSPFTEDYEYVQTLGGSLIPSRLGAGDWVDPDLFQSRPGQEKVYDIVMVASWIRWKRHKLLFSAISQCGDHVKKVALIGYPWEGRTKADILREADQFGVRAKLEIFESIPRQQVSQIIGQSKIGVMLTVREGANKGIYECLFSDVPVIVSSQNMGVNRDHINASTGLLADDNRLHEKIIDLLHNLASYSPRDWALKTTGYKNATRLLNDCLKAQALKSGEAWSKDIYAKKNDPNAMFAFDRDRVEADQAMSGLRDLLRN